MAEAKLYGQNKGGMSINGIIKDYYAYAGENIGAGDLVEYVNGVASKTTETITGTSGDTPINNTTAYSGFFISAVQLDENRVFIAHNYDDDYYLYGIVVTISGATITPGTDTQLISGTYYARGISAQLLPNGNVFISHSYSSNNYLYGMVVSINETTITAGTDTSLANVKNSAMAHSSCVLPNGNVLITHLYDSSNNYLSGIVVNIDGTTITKGTDTTLSTKTSAGLCSSPCVLPNGNVFIAHNSLNYYYLCGMVVTISGSTITVGTHMQLTTATGTGYGISTCLLPNGNVFIAHSYSDSHWLYGMVVGIDDTTITKGTDIALLTNNSTSYTGEIISTCLLPNGNVFIAHSYGTSYRLYGMVVSIDDTTITLGSYTKLNETGYTGYKISTLLLDNGAIFVAHSHTQGYYYLYAQIWDIDETNNVPTNNITIEKVNAVYETQVRKVTTGQFDGVAKTSGTGGDDTGHNDLVSIWTLE